jgi:hypothetical protein
MAVEFGMCAMTDHVQTEMPKDESIDVELRWFVKGLLTGATGLVFTTAAASSAFARRRRKKGQGNGSQPQTSTKGRGKHRRY